VSIGASAGSAKGVQHRGAVAGDAGDEHQRQQSVEKPDRKIELCRRKVRADQRKEAARQQSHPGRRGHQQQADPQHRARQQLLGAVVALPFPHPHQRGHKGLVH
jgi:hypothetical protein